MESKLPFDLRVDVIRWYMEHEVAEEDDLWRLVSSIVGHKWLRHSVCRGHESPWDLIREGYFVKHGEILGVGPRGGEKTRSVGVLNVADMITHPEIEIAHAAAALPQAARAHEWTKRFLMDDAVRASGKTDDL